MRCCRALHLPQQSRRVDGSDDLSEPSVPSNLPARRTDCDSHFVCHCVYPHRYRFIIWAAWDEFAIIKTATTMARGDWQNQITRVRKHRLFMKASHFNNCQISGGTSIEWMCPLSVLSVSLFPDSVFIWQIQTCRLGMPLYSSRGGWDIFCQCDELLHYMPSYTIIIEFLLLFPCGGFSYFTHSIMKNEIWD